MGSDVVFGSWLWRFCRSCILDLPKALSMREAAIGCRVPIAVVEMQSSGQWFQLRRAFNNMWAANGGPFDSWPIPIRITSVLNDTVYDRWVCLRQHHLVQPEFQQLILLSGRLASMQPA